MSNNNFVVDNEAKLSCDLFMRRDAVKKSYFTAKLQFNGSLDLSEGQCFMIFVSEENNEELQIGPLDPERAKHVDVQAEYVNGRLCVGLRKHIDGGGNTIYIGELKGIGEISCKKGLHFTVFTSIEGREELQITALNLTRARARKAQKNDEFLQASNG